MRCPTSAKLKSGEPAVFERYKSFVSYLLYACDGVMSAFPDQQEWRKSCAYEIREHLPFLCETQTSDPDFLETFGGRSIDFVRVGDAAQRRHRAGMPAEEG